MDAAADVARGGTGPAPALGGSGARDIIHALSGIIHTLSGIIHTLSGIIHTLSGIIHTCSER
jgi:hypothetical protein